MREYTMKAMKSTSEWNRQFLKERNEERRAYFDMQTFVSWFLYLDLKGRRCLGAQWLSGRVLDSRLRGRWFEPHWLHCVMVLEQDTFILV